MFEELGDAGERRGQKPGITQQGITHGTQRENNSRNRLIQDTRRLKPPKALESMQVLPHASLGNEAVGERWSRCRAGSQRVWVRELALSQLP